MILASPAPPINPTNLLIFTNITNTKKKIELIYPDLSYKIIGVVFDIFNELGYGYQEKYYQKAIAKSFNHLSITYKEQIPYAIKFKGEIIGRYFLDFLIDNKIILEIKKETNFRRHNIQQVVGYLRKTNLKLGILVNFTKDGVKFKRILNIY